jgi:localization factor PodJL
VAADPAKAVHWYEVAAQQGNRKAMHNLAVAYAQGTGTTKDLAQASQWFSRAANLGLADSQFNLAVLYERGMGVPQSLPDAFKWYAVAASQGDAESKARIDALSTQLSTPDRIAAQHAADSFKPQPMDRSANIPPDPAALFG